MKLKNIGNKIISIGATVILPGEAKEVTGYDNLSLIHISEPTRPY